MEGRGHEFKAARQATMVLVVVVVLVLAVVVRALVAARPQDIREHAEGRH